MEDNPLEASASQSSTRGGDTMPRQEDRIGLFTKLDNTMSSLVGIVSQLTAGQGQSALMASDPRAAMGEFSSCCISEWSAPDWVYLFLYASVLFSFDFYLVGRFEHLSGGGLDVL